MTAVAQVQQHVRVVGHWTEDGQVISTLRPQTSSQVLDIRIVLVDWLNVKVLAIQSLQVSNAILVKERLVMHSEVHEGNYPVLARLQLSIGVAAIAQLQVHIVVVFFLRVRQVH